MAGGVEVLVVQVSAPAAEAPSLARKLVEARLAACVQLLPGVRSVYRWKDAVEEAEETLLLIKSTRDVFPALAACVREHHSYEVPEILGLPTAEAWPAYANGVASEVRPPS